QLAACAPRTVQDAATVHAADRQLFEQIKSGRIPAHRAARQVRRAERNRKLARRPRLPRGRFELIYADPPWQLGNPTGANAPENHYPTLTTDAIKTLSVPAADDAILFLWVPCAQL